MICPKCKSRNVTVQMLYEAKEVARKGVLYWLIIGWWWEPIAWICFTFPKALFALFGKHKKIVSKAHEYYVCQNCGFYWE